MQLKQLIDDDDAVSPVIGVILMVAITVILAAVIGTFVLGLGDRVSNTAPTASFTFDYSNPSSGGDTLEIVHDGGDSIPVSQLNASVSGSSSSDGNYKFSNLGVTGDVTAGDVATLNSSNGLAGTPDLSGATVRVVWQASGGGKTSTLGKWTGPDA